MSDNKDKGSNKGSIFSFFKKKNSDKNINNIQEDNSSNEQINEQIKADDTPNYLKIGKGTPVYDVWEEWTEKSDNVFDPFEYVIEDFKEIIEINKKNDTDDESVEDIKVLISKLLSSSEAVNNVIISEKIAKNADKSVNEKSISDERFSDLKAFGGLNSADELNRFEVFEDAESTGPNGDVYEMANKIISQKGDKLSEALKEPAPFNAEIFINISENKMQAYIYIYPPRNGGADVTVEMLQNILKDKGIVYGIDNNMIIRTANKKLYFKLIKIARGMDCIDGKDGEIIDIVPKETEVDIHENEEGRINFKELNLIKNIKKGDHICQIIQPLQGKNGMNILGKEIISRNGKMPIIPRGKNTQLSEDGQYLEAAIDGHISYSAGLFNVQNLLTISGDVDNSTGNINYTGDVLIKGKVREGFSVKADGNITIKGNVETCVVIVSGGDISIGSGVSGGAHGLIEAKGSIKIKYIENCKICAGDKIETEVIIDSEIECDNSLIVMRGKGTIVGGKITVGKQIEVRVIGNENNSSRITEIVLGCMPNMIKQRNMLKKQIEDTDAGFEKLTANINYLEKFGDKLDAARKNLLSQLRLQLGLRQMEKAKYSKLLENANNIIENISYCKLKSGIIYPVTTVKIGHEMQTIHEIQRNVNIGIVPPKEEKPKS